MTNQPIPKQFFTLSVLLLLWFCSFGFFDGNTKDGWGANVLSSQTVAVIACYFISRDWWSWTVIMLEGICAIYTGIVLYRWDVLDDFFYAHHHGFMVACFIIELLIITLSVGAVNAGNVYRRSLSKLGDYIRVFLRSGLRDLFGEVAQ